MPRAKASTEEPIRRTGPREIIGMVWVTLALLLLISLFSFRPQELPVTQQPPNPTSNIIGLVGAWSAFAWLYLLGFAAYALPVVLAVHGTLCMVGEDRLPRPRLRPKLIWMLVLLVCTACLMELLAPLLSAGLAWRNLPFAGGIVGQLVGSLFLIRFMGEIGTAILMGLVVLIAGVSLFDVEVGAVVRDPKGTLGPVWRKLTGWMSAPEALEDLDLGEEAPLVAVSARRKKKPKAEAVSEPEELPFEPPAVPENALFPEPENVDDLFGPPEPVSPPVPAPAPPAPAAESSIFKRRSAPKKSEAASASAEDGVEFADVDRGSGQLWQLPPVSILQAVTNGVVADTAREEYLRQLLERTLKEFGVEAKITEVQRGPVVTSFEVLPAPGVRVEKIAGLSNNLALALKAESIRVQAPIPGKGVVGIEVPNRKSTVVFARQIIESADWEKSRDWRRGKVALPLCLGVDVSGNNLVGDLADMPHLLIAGATGSGKSVCMNSLLAGLLMSRTPEQLRLILVDPKIVEFTAYRDLPHLVVPVITDPKKVGLGLRWAITEMEKRYKLFAKVGVRNIRGFNTRPIVTQGDLFGEEPAQEESHPETLPYIVIVIDELADLMMVAQAEIENYIARLAQLSRAVGIHMILATQRPSVNVITGTIKANFPSRIAFQVAQKTDSRTILDAIGADKLLGKGDMLFLAPSSAKLQRAQGAWTSDEEINKIVDFIKAQGTPDYENKVTEKLTNTAPELPSQDEDDGLIEQAVEVIRQTRRASTSSLQRRLRIGYNRAARLMDQLEEKGIIGPPQGSDPREILIDLEGEVPSQEANGLQMEEEEE